jgi:hypothetical protein
VALSLCGFVHTVGTITVGYYWVALAFLVLTGILFVNAMLQRSREKKITELDCLS